MRKTHYLFLSTSLLLTSCSTLNESVQLGAGMGALAGAAATYAAESSRVKNPAFENVAVGAGVGLAIGAITSYFVHKQVDEQRQAFFSDQTEMHFGDLPPSPFIVPKMIKKGGR